MRLNEVNSIFETHKVIVYNAAHTKALHRNIEMQRIQGNLFADKEEQDDYGRIYRRVYGRYDILRP